VPTSSDCCGYDMMRDGSLCGQSYLFLRYLYDQAGGETVQTDGSFVDDGGIAWMNDCGRRRCACVGQARTPGVSHSTRISTMDGTPGTSNSTRMQISSPAPTAGLK